jgi:peptidoglycan/xylan/chitin deacetylase (PgdA/CDA1 family)
VKLTRLGRTVVGLAALVAILIPTVVATAHSRATLAISVDGKAERVRRGTTVAEAADRFGVHPAAGDLLDVEGNVLEPGVVAGQVLVNGRPADAATVLRAGDALTRQAGADRTEARVRSVFKTEGTPTNPQFSLAGAPGREIVVSGANSDEVVSARFRPSGPVSTPPVVALTFDDGPGPYTERILAVLRRYGVAATFFVIGIHVRDHPDVVRDEVRAGMAVGNHSWDHPSRPPFAKLRSARLRAEIDRTEDLLVSMGIAPRFFRPPGGSFSQRVIDGARAVDSRVVLWDVDPRDWVRGHSPGGIVRAVLSAVKPGAIVELHDGGPNAAALLAALPRIIEGIRAKGLRFGALGS